MPLSVVKSIPTSKYPQSPEIPSAIPNVCNPTLTTKSPVYVASEAGLDISKPRPLAGPIDSDVLDNGQHLVVVVGSERRMLKII